MKWYLQSVGGVLQLRILLSLELCVNSLCVLCISIWAFRESKYTIAVSFGEVFAYLAAYIDGFQPANTTTVN
jgi:hypothetical protein